jgi:hypothetical protein
MIRNALCFFWASADGKNKKTVYIETLEKCRPARVERSAE